MLDDEPQVAAVGLGETVQLGYVDQSRDDLDGNKTVWEEISGGQDEITLGGRRRNTRAYVASFNFLGSDQQKKVKDLSGGERNRVHLAKLLRHGLNVLLLDEPTSSVDMRTELQILDALQRLLGGRTSFLIAHRASTLAHCDKVLVLGAGAYILIEVWELDATAWATSAASRCR